MGFIQTAVNTIDTTNTINYDQYMRTTQSIQFNLLFSRVTVTVTVIYSLTPSTTVPDLTSETHRTHDILYTDTEVTYIVPALQYFYSYP